MSDTLNILLAQINPTVGRLSHNAELMREIWREAKDADLVVFPELALSGYPPEDLVLKPFFINALEQEIEKLCEDSRDFSAAALIPTPVKIEGEIYNAALLIEGGEVIATILKHHLPNYGVFDEMRVFTAAPPAEPVDFRGVRLGIMICEDMWFANVAAHLKKRGAEILIVPNASPYDSGKGDIRRDHALKRVSETGLPLIYVNQTGGQDELVFDGVSFALNPDGVEAFEAPAFTEHTAMITFTRGAKAPIAAAEITPPLSRLESIYRALVTGLRDYVMKNNFPGVLLGLSGGVDSALTAVIAADALSPGKVHAVMMPSQYTSLDSLEDAAILARNLGIRLDEMSIEEPVETLTATLEPLLEDGTPPVTFENLQSRARGLLLMALSNASGKMVLSTGNKSEMAVGYATLYGDMCGGFNALKDVYKTQVYELCRWRNAQGDAPVIPERILVRAPTAELRDNQTDQDTLPPYDVLDDILTCLIEHDMGLEEIAGHGHDLATVTKVWKMLDSAEYKRRQAPPGVKITTRAFGRDRRYPITNHFAKRIEKSGI